MTLMLPDPRLFADGFVMVESGRWHDGRLWFAHWGAGEVVAVDLMGQTEVMAPGRTTMGWAIDWLPNGGLLVSGKDLALIHPNGSTERYSGQGGNEVVVDLAGHVYVNGADFDFAGGGEPSTGVDPLGSARRNDARGRWWHRVPERHGRHPRRIHTCHRGVFRRPTVRL